MGVGGAPPTRIADLTTRASEPDSVTGAAAVRGWISEHLIVGSYVSPGIGTVTPFSPTLQFLDTATIPISNARIRSLLIVVTTTFVVAGQASVRLASGRRAAVQAVGAASSYPDIPNEGGLLGPSVNFGAATNLAAGVYWITPSSVGGGAGAAGGLPDLQWPLEYVGAEINFGAAPTAGALYVAFVTAPI
jgi:hypothetical protein